MKKEGLRLKKGGRLNVIVMGGLGQVGSALADLLQDARHEVYILDPKGDMKPNETLKYDFLHVTIPYDDCFNSSVKSVIRKYRPKNVIVHSTVPVGTTRKLGAFCAHSPVRGQHPNLKIGLLRFVKYVGARNPETLERCASHLKGIGLTVETWNNSDDTELAKMLCLSRYLNDLSFYEVAFRTCRKFGVAPIRVLQWTNTYNDGYAGTKYVRPELSFPRGKVGGHCVMPVAKMLSTQTGYKYFKTNLDVFDEDACLPRYCKAG